MEHEFVGSKPTAYGMTQQSRPAKDGGWPPSIGEPYDVLSDGDTIEGLAIVRTGLAIDLRRSPADAPIEAALERAYRGRASVVVKPRQRNCPYIELDDLV